LINGLRANGLPGKNRRARIVRLETFVPEAVQEASKTISRMISGAKQQTADRERGFSRQALVNSAIDQGSIAPDTSKSILQGSGIHNSHAHPNTSGSHVAASTGAAAHGFYD
jgi:hypothetical protein